MAGAGTAARSSMDALALGLFVNGMQLPPPMKSFLKQYDLKGKTVIPFNTNDGYGVGSSFQTVKEMCPKSRVPEGFTTTGGTERDGVTPAIRGPRAKEVRAQVQEWLRRIKVSVVKKAESTKG